MVASTFSIRLAKPEDVPTLLLLIKELAHFEKLSHEVVADEQALQVALFGERPCVEALLAEQGKEPIGFALFFHNFSTFLAKPGLYLEDLYVRPHARGAGAGKALFKALAQLAQERNCGRMEWSVLDWNESAIRFYKSLGASPMSEWTVFRMTQKEILSLCERRE